MQSASRIARLLCVVALTGFPLFISGCSAVGGGGGGGGGPIISDPPELGSVGDQTVPLGRSLTFRLAATDSEGDNLTFSASPLPLPVNAALTATTGEFTFRPAADQVGRFDLTFMVSDGTSVDSEDVTITVPEPPVDGVTELAGRLLDTNDFVLGVETPVDGATVEIFGVEVSTLSHPDGNFLLTGIPDAEETVLDIDTTSALPRRMVPRMRVFAKRLSLSKASPTPSTGRSICRASPWRASPRLCRSR